MLWRSKAVGMTAVVGGRPGPRRGSGRCGQLGDHLWCFENEEM